MVKRVLCWASRCREKADKGLDFFSNARIYNSRAALPINCNEVLSMSMNALNTVIGSGGTSFEMFVSKEAYHPGTGFKILVT
jgi:hypothetical protein